MRPVPKGSGNLVYLTTQTNSLVMKIRTNLTVLSFYVVLILIFSNGCSNQKNNDYLLRIDKFETTLGKEDHNMLEEIIAKFNGFLEQRYVGYTDSNLFKTYLREITRTGDIEFMEVDSLPLFQSTLFKSYEFEYPDSVWIVNSFVHVKYPSFPIEDIRIPLGVGDESLNDLVNKITNVPEIRISNIGSFYLALESVRKNDTIVDSYLENKEALGMIHPALLVGGVLSHLNDESEFFLTRIYVMEMIEHEQIRVLRDSTDGLHN